MNRSENLDESNKPFVVISCENIAMGYKKGVCDFNDYALNFTDRLLDGSEETWGQCFDTMPSGIDRRAYLKYLEDEIESYDFEPYPSLHVFDYYTKDQINMVKKELKPKYIALVRFAKNRLTQ